MNAVQIVFRFKAQWRNISYDKFSPTVLHGLFVKRAVNCIIILLEKSLNVQMVAEPYTIHDS